MFWALPLATMAFRRHCLTPAVKSWVFGVCQELVGRETPSSKQSLYPPTCTTRLPLKAFRREPAISGFDRLFTPYPQVIQTSCDMNWCGLPSHFRGTSPCSWVAHPVSGLAPATYSPYSDSLSLWLRLETALTSHRRQTRWLIMQKAHSYPAPFYPRNLISYPSDKKF